MTPVTRALLLQEATKHLMFAFTGCAAPTLELARASDLFEDAGVPMPKEFEEALKKALK